MLLALLKSTKSFLHDRCKTPPNPIKLLDSKKMKTLVKDICKENEFDLIIFDCPPVLGLSDSLIISEFVDGVIPLSVLIKLIKNC